MRNKNIFSQFDSFKEAIQKSDVLAMKTKQNYLNTLKHIIKLIKKTRVRKIDKENFESVKRILINKDHSYNAVLNKFAHFIETGEIKIGLNVPFKRVFSYRGIIGRMHSAFVSEISGELNDSTVQKHIKYIDSFCFYCENERVKKLSYNLINNFIEQARFKNQNDAYFKLSSIKYFIKKLFKLDLIDIDFSHKIKCPRLIKRKPKIKKYTSEEIEIILNSISKNSKNFYRNILIVILLIRYGLRSVDIAKLKFDLIQESAKQIFIIQSKTSKVLTLPLLDDVKIAIDNYVQFERPKYNSPYIIFYKRKLGEFMEPKTVGCIIGRILKNSGINLNGRHCSPKSFRSSLGMELIDKGVPSRKIAQVLGHSNTYSLGNYTLVEKMHLLKCVKDVSLIKKSFYSQNLD